jgi:glycine dehydrogenase subunit 1
MRYLPHTEQDIDAMLKTIGVRSLDDLYQGIPSSLRFRDALNLSTGLTENELRIELREMAGANINATEYQGFIGGGAYHHYVPSLVSYLVKRGEFLTAYTPYQPEVSQGTLQAVFEFQTMMCELTGMAVANASNYDLSTACAEAVMMAHRITGRKTVLVSRSLHPHYRDVLATYLTHQDYHIIEIPFGGDGRLDGEFLLKHLNEKVACVLLQSPNFFGVVEKATQIGNEVKKQGALFVMANAEALSYAALKTPGACGADIAIGEGMSLGIGLNYGGPYLGIFAAQSAYLRNMPGRLVGETVDQEGRRGYVLTMATREQHIRREKATSNICTNQGLCALTAAIYLSLMGPQGLHKLALMNMSRLKLLESLVHKRYPEALRFSAPKFNETVIRLKSSVKDAVIDLLKDNIMAGIDLGTYYPELENHLLLCTTEMNTLLTIETLVQRLGRFL